MPFLSGVFYLVVRKFVYANEPDSSASGRVSLAGQAIEYVSYEVGVAMSRGRKLAIAPLECATLVTPSADVGHTNTY